ncbi:MAG: hypothetical protein U9N45_07455, partial [Gemmatimonadota bacterium]|nr:hypothetical protein [Gemmatimonadota bacterium]
DVALPADGFKQDILVQGTVDGEPVVTARYGGGNDFMHLAGMMEARGKKLERAFDPGLLEKTLDQADCFVLPNIARANRLTGPFPELEGRIVNEDAFFENPEKALVLANLCTAITAACRLEAVSGGGRDLPVVLTGGGSTDPWFGRLIAALTGREVYAMFDRNGRAITETTTLGAAATGKAACLKAHPIEVDLSALGVSYRKMEPFNTEILRKLQQYRERFMAELVKAGCRLKNSGKVAKEKHKQAGGYRLEVKHKGIGIEKA